MGTVAFSLTPPHFQLFSFKQGRMKLANMIGFPFYTFQGDPV